MRRHTLPSAVAAFMLVASPAGATTVAVQSDGATVRKDCAGGDAAIAGSRNTVAFAGACRSLQVRGDSNVVEIVLGPAAAIDIAGAGNRISVAPVAGAAPSVVVSGGRTTLSAASSSGSVAVVAAGPIALIGDHQDITLDCTGQKVTIQGNASRYTLHGGCSALSAHGAGNTIVAALRPMAPVEVEGNDSRLSYSVVGQGGPPVLAMRGVNAAATPDAPLQAVSPSVPVAVAVPVLAAPVLGVPMLGVPMLMHDLGGKVEARGTAVTLLADALFLSGSADIAPTGERSLSRLADLIAQIHPSGLCLIGTDPADAGLAARRTAAIAALLAARHVSVKTTQVHTVIAGAAAVKTLILR